MTLRWIIMLLWIREEKTKQKNSPIQWTFRMQRAVEDEVHLFFFFTKNSKHLLHSAQFEFSIPVSVTQRRNGEREGEGGWKRERRKGGRLGRGWARSKRTCNPVITNGLLNFLPCKVFLAFSFSHVLCHVLASKPNQRQTHECFQASRVPFRPLSAFLMLYSLSGLYKDAI